MNGHFFKTKFILALFFAVPAILLAIARVSAESKAPNIEEMTKILQQAVAKYGNDKTAAVKVRAVLGCYPVAGAANEFICLVDANGPDGEFHVQEFQFRTANGKWEFQHDSERTDPACPGKSEAQALLRKSMHDDKLEITDMPAEGNFTEERGMSRDKKGPMRLMCTYGTKGTLGDRTIVGYFQYSDGRYTIDSDREVWTD